jgi:uncharacterized protein YjiS (DUF1127 family)
LRADGIAWPRGNNWRAEMFATLSTIFGPAVTRGPGGFIRRLLRAWARDIPHYFVRQAAIKSLREFNDRELRDMGLTRSQIEVAVYGSMPRPDRPGRDTRGGQAWS